MAVLGVQLVLTIIIISIIRKLNPHFSFAKWILCSTGLQRFLHPTDNELRTQAGLAKEKPVKGAKNRHTQFHVPRQIEIELQTTPVVARDVVHLRYFTEYQWLLDFSIYAALVYTISEIYHHYMPLKNEVNLSIVWCLLVIFFAIKLMSSLTILYFKGDESISERSIIIVAYLVYLLIAMIALIIDESILETGLENAYATFNRSASEFLTSQGLPSSGPASKIVVQFFLALACGSLGSLFIFPGLRMAKMHWDSLKYCRSNKLMQLLLNISFVLPFFLVILWIRPISRDYLTIRVFSGMQYPILKPHTYETLRLSLVIFTIILRFGLMPIYLQSYLNLASDRVMQLRQEAGRITNIDLQKRIASIFHYLCVVSLQFTAPLILCLYLTLMYKSVGGFSWVAYHLAEPAAANECSAAEKLETTTPMPTIDMISGIGDMFDSSNGVKASDANLNILKSAEFWTGLKDVFTTEVLKGFLGFVTWWSYLTLFSSSCLGIIYQSYFNAV